MRVREWMVPLQAFLAIVICGSLMWMVYAMAFFDPTPPTAAEIRSFATEDLQLDRLQTAAALTVDAFFAVGPTQILLPTFTPSVTPVYTLTIAYVPGTVTGVGSVTATWTSTLALTFTSTPRNNPQIPSATSTVTMTFTPRPTATSLPTSTPTATNLPTATSTDLPTPTDFPTPTDVPTDLPTPTDVPTEKPPTPTDEPTATEPPVDTAVP